MARFTVCPLGVPLSSRRHLHIGDKHSQEPVLVTNDKQVIACRLGCELGEAGASASSDMLPGVVCAGVGEVWQHKVIYTHTRWARDAVSFVLFKLWVHRMLPSWEFPANVTSLPLVTQIARWMRWGSTQSHSAACRGLKASAKPWRLAARPGTGLEEWARCSKPGPVSPPVFSRHLWPPVFSVIVTAASSLLPGNTDGSPNWPTWGFWCDSSSHYGDGSVRIGGLLQYRLPLLETHMHPCHPLSAPFWAACPLACIPPVRLPA